MKYDAKVPSQLKKTQQWFGSIISRPISEYSQMNMISPSGNRMEEESSQFIAPSPTLQPWQRIQIYNQQYWWRLLNTLQEAYAFVTRLFGCYDFNQMIGIPYLDKYPPNHWSLFQLGDRLPKWMEEDYKVDDKPLVLDAAMIDRSFNTIFVAPGYQPIAMENLPTPGDISSILHEPIYLQPYVHFYQLRYDLFSVRQEMLKQEPDYWLEHDFPVAERDKAPYYFVLFRTPRSSIRWEIQSRAAFETLQLFKEGISIEELCEWLEKQDAEISGEASQNLHLWLQNWISNQWLHIKNDPI